MENASILFPKQIRKFIERDKFSSDFWKKRALNWAAQDNEYLIRGEIPKQIHKNFS
ncbi:hypothetical protein B4119_3504 [Parageobacillus caldoxylosilyticus]|uniref:Uncharacterized protein n=1 Tax=Saccharococcus caldoxylosilyticus TaxID=81408 RepID=A0A150L607_9BACL|nr:hypothetical protein B4119_3504 [Parageobacillus caldoxylosilyticus]